MNEERDRLEEFKKTPCVSCHTFKGIDVPSKLSQPSQFHRSARGGEEQVYRMPLPYSLNRTTSIHKQKWSLQKACVLSVRCFADTTY